MRSCRAAIRRPRPPREATQASQLQRVLPSRMSSSARIEIPPHVRWLVFDCDGTIADTMPLHYEAWVAALKEHSVEFPEALFYELAGIPTAKIIEMLNERHGHNMPVQETADYKEGLYQQL